MRHKTPPESWQIFRAVINLLNESFMFFNVRLSPLFYMENTFLPPNISAIPVVIKNSGETILIAASALLPTPCPTKIPSATVKSDANTIYRQ